MPALLGPLSLALLALPVPQDPEAPQPDDPVVATLRGHSGHVARVAFHPDGNALATVGHDSTVRLWETATWQERVVLPVDSQQLSVAISPDGKYLAAAGDFVVRIWKLRRLPKRRVEDAWEPIEELKIPEGLDGFGATVWDLAFAPDSKTLAVGTFAGTVLLWDTSKWDQLTTLAGHLAAADGNNLVEFVDWSRDGRQLVSGGKTNEALVWAIEGRGTRRKDRVLWQLDEEDGGPPAHRMCAAFAPRGDLLAIGGTDGRIQLVATDGGFEVRHTLLAHPGAYAHALAFAPDGSRLYSVGDDLRIWDPTSGERLGSIQLGGAAHEIAIAPGGELAVVAEFDGPVRVIRLPGD